MTAVSIWAFISGQLPPVWAKAVLPGALLLAWVGWMDDARPVSPWTRLIIQVAVSFYLIVFIRESGQLIPIWHALVAVGLLVWVMNLFNFMDGSHGMAGFQALYAGAVLAVILAISGQPQLALAASVIAGAALGFLPWNFPRPRVFMGDVASVPLGFVIGAVILQGITIEAIHPAVALLVMAIFLADGTPTLLRRVFRGERWYTPHTQHMYQRLIRQGWSHSRVLTIYQTINVLLVLPATVLAVMYPEQAWPVTGACFFVLLAGWYAASRRVEVHI
jgi:UDP-N-acetylmuramyl pentapeptide phosphotransferase/UDP-N-acetylglucosamine-1-phosphate transferase